MERGVVFDEVAEGGELAGGGEGVEGLLPEEVGGLVEVEGVESGAASFIKEHDTIGVTDGVVESAVEGLGVVTFDGVRSDVEEGV